MFNLPELNLQHKVQWIRIPAEQDVPVTARIKAILDSAAMRRLTRVTQLGLVSLVYPGATHSRMEHSLGVYRLAVQALKQLLQIPDCEAAISESSAKVFLVAALVHDIGHWPFCHPLEDMKLPWVPRHEQLASTLLHSDELASILREQWQVEPASVAEFLAPPSHASPDLLHSLLNGPIDVDKMDYLQRDSLHAGVPYGRNFDIGRLIHSLCAGPGGNRVAITEKGKTAAEMMVFARYVMFSEVYWHHAVRGATAMLQRVVYELSRSSERDTGERDAGEAQEAAISLEPKRWLMQSETEFTHDLLERTRMHPALHEIVQGLFGDRRRLFKRLGQFNFNENPAVHAALARRPYTDLVRCAERLSQRLSNYMSTHSNDPLLPTDVLIDAPPVKLEVQFNLDVRQRTAADSDSTDSHPFTPLGKLSPVVNSLATNQFDNFVKRVRVFVHPDRLGSIRITSQQLTDELLASAEESAKDSPEERA